MAFKQYLETHNVGLKEFNSMVSSKITQLRSERTKTVYNYFHNSVLPTMSKVEPKVFKAIVKSLSQVYRNKDIDVDDVISQINGLISGRPSINTHTPSPSRNIIEPEVPESPSHKITEEKKKKISKKCVKQLSPKTSKTVVPVKPPKEKKKMIKKLVKSLEPMKEEEPHTTDEDVSE